MSGNHTRILTERSIVLALIATLAKDGWKPTHINYGDGTMRFSYSILWDVDEAAVRFTKGGNSHDVIFIFGNGEDVISDWRYAEDDADGFNAILEGFSMNGGLAISSIIRCGAQAQRSIKQS